MEKPPNIFEESPESFPASGEVQSVFEKLIGEGKYETVRKREDEKGLYLWDVAVSAEDGKIEYSYMRRGQYPEGKALDTAIHITFFDKESFPVGGYSVAKYIGGKWGIIP